MNLITIADLLNWIIYTFLILAFLFMLGNLMTWHLQHLFILPPGKSTKNTDYHFKDLFKEVFLVPAPGAKIHCLWFRSNEPSRGVILYLHGNAGNLGHWGGIGPRFTQMGFDILIPDYRGYGKSTGRIEEEAFYVDALACWNFLETNYPDVPKFIYGRSLGSGPASWLAGNTEAKGLILETPYTSMKDLFYTYYSFLPRWFLFRYEFPNAENLKKCMSPILIFAGVRDWIVPFRCSIKLKSSLKKSDEFVAIAEGGHAHLSSFPEYKAALEKWFEERLKG